MEEHSLTLITVFFAGVGSFLSPCVLPIMPTFVAIMAGTALDTGAKGRRCSLIVNSVCFLCGFSLVFVAMGATASFFGQILISYQQVISKAGAIFMVFMGLYMCELIKLPILNREYRPLMQGNFAGPLGAFLLGIAFSVGWTPCTGPILAAILIYAGTTNTVAQGAFMLLIYSVGFAVPFFIITLLISSYADKLKSYYRWLPVVQKIAGITLILTGIMIFFNLMPKVISLLLN